jgi:hypothetical protein
VSFGVSALLLWADVVQDRVVQYVLGKDLDEDGATEDRGAKTVLKSNSIADRTSE